MSSSNPNSTRFTSRQGPDLIDENGNRFRWLSFDAPSIHQLGAPLWKLPTPWEQKDALFAVYQLGGRLIRIGPLSVRRDTDLASIPRNIDAVDKYAEEVFQSLDKVISIAKELSLRVVIPLIDGSPDAETGGVGAFAALRGLPPAAFYSDPGLRRDWKKVVSYFMNRVNNVTGKPYKLEPAIAAWQLGSNLDTQNRSALEDWAMDMASFIKAEDPNHLLWDGSVTSQWSAKYAAHPSIDGFTTSYSGSTVKVPPVDSNLLLGLQIALFFFGASGILLSVSPKWVKSLKEQKGFSSRKSILLLIFNALVFAASTVAFGMLTATAVRTTTSQQNIFQDVTLPLRFNKSSVVSRFEMMDVKTLKGFCTDLITSGAAGGFLGELTFRREQGGFYVKQLSGDWWSYSWPGIAPNATNGFPNDNSETQDALRYYAGMLAGRDYAYSLWEPAPPTILPFSPSGGLRFQGSVGARYYIVQRSSDYGTLVENATWVNVRSNLTESELPMSGAGWVDATAIKGRTYWYLMKAVNEAGFSRISNVVVSPAPSSTIVTSSLASPTSVAPGSGPANGTASSTLATSTGSAAVATKSAA